MDTFGPETPQLSSELDEARAAAVAAMASEADLGRALVEVR